MTTKTVWTEFTPLSIEYKSVNLGQGFPDFEPDAFVIDATTQALEKQVVQYTRSQGHPRLVQALSKTYSPIYGRDLDPMQDIIVTVGAAESISLAFLTFCDQGDEVIVFEPFYDTYPSSILIAGGVPVYVPIVSGGKNETSKDWSLDREMFLKSITPKTKMIIFSNPSVAIGKVWSKEDLQFIADTAIQHNLLVISDEVYEWMVYDQLEHIKIATLPNMFERTLTIGSAGKTFSVTGYRIGWTIGPSVLIERLQAVHTNVAFCVPSPLQEGIAVALEKAEELNYFKSLHDLFENKRKHLCDVLTKSGLKPVIPEGSYFIMADTSNIADDVFFDEKDEAPRDYQFCRWMTKTIGVTAIPPSAFYSVGHKHMVKNYARFAFCKRDENFVEASNRLTKLQSNN